MKIEEAIKAMREGSKIRHSTWSNGVYIFKNNDFLSETCEPCTDLNGEYFFDDNWEIYEKYKMKIGDRLSSKFDVYEDNNFKKLVCKIGDVCLLESIDIETYFFKNESLDTYFGINKGTVDNYFQKFKEES